MSAFSEYFRNYITALESGEQLVWLFRFNMGYFEGNGKPDFDILGSSFANITTCDREVEGKNFRGIVLGGLPRPVEQSDGSFKGDRPIYTHSLVSFTNAGSSTTRYRTDGRLTLANLEDSYIKRIRQAGVAPWVRIYALLYSRKDEPNPYELGPIDMKMGRIRYDANDISIPLVVNDLFKEPFQKYQFDPATTPALYA